MVRSCLSIALFVLLLWPFGAGAGSMCDSPNLMSSDGIDQQCDSPASDPTVREAAAGVGQGSLQKGASIAGAVGALTTQAAVSACDAAAGSAMSSCATDSSNPLWQNAFTAANNATTALNSSGGAAACGQVQNVTMAANGAILAMKASCSSAYDACHAACYTKDLSGIGSSDSLYSDLSAARKNCNSASSRLSDMGVAASGLMQSYQSSVQCAQDAAQSAQLASQSQQSACALNPSLCVSASTPTTPQGGGGAGSGGSSDSGILGSGQPIRSDLGSNVGGGAGTGSGPDGSILQGNQNDPSVNPGAGGPGMMPGFAGGGDPGIGHMAASTNKIDPPKAAARAASKYNTNVLAGKVGAPSAVTGTGEGGRASGEPGSYSKTGSWIPPKVGPNPMLIGMNLDRYRPSLQGYRMPSSIGNNTDLLSADANIWKAMNIRYLTVIQSLTP